MRTRTIFVAVVVVALTLICSAQPSDYKTGKIVSVQRAQMEPQTGLKTNAVRFEIVVEVDDTPYTCEYLALTGLDPTWAHGAEVQVRVKDTVL